MHRSLLPECTRGLCPGTSIKVRASLRANETNGLLFSDGHCFLAAVLDASRRSMDALSRSLNGPRSNSNRIRFCQIMAILAVAKISQRLWKALKGILWKCGGIDTYIWHLRYLCRCIDPAFGTPSKQVLALFTDQPFTEKTSTCNVGQPHV